MFNFKIDPLNEEKYTIFPGLIHKHPDRILVELNFTCPVICPFCTRKRKKISKNNFNLGMAGWKKVESYIKKNLEIREVILSGGDPLMTPDLLIKILERLKLITQIKVVRIHTRMPITAPKKIDKRIFDYFKKESKKRVFYMSIHCDHSHELMEKAKKTIEKLRLSGVILYSQSVFLKGYNDSVEILKELFESLLKIGVRPYYIYHCDKIEDYKKFAVPLTKEKKIIRKLNKMISGLACPILIVDSKDEKKRTF
jgi:lysine 2,3-aminomutase